MTAYPGQTLTQTMLGQLCTALWDSKSRPVVLQPGIEPGSVVTPLALRCSVLDRCDTAWNGTRVFVVMPLALRCSVLDHCTTLEPT